MQGPALGFANSVYPSGFSFRRPGPCHPGQQRHLPPDAHLSRRWRRQCLRVKFLFSLHPRFSSQGLEGSLPPPHPHLSSSPGGRRLLAALPPGTLPPLGRVLLQWLYLFFHLRNANQKKTIISKKINGGCWPLNATETEDGLPQRPETKRTRGLCAGKVRGPGGCARGPPDGPGCGHGVKPRGQPGTLAWFSQPPG